MFAENKMQEKFGASSLAMFKIFSIPSNRFALSGVDSRKKNVSILYENPHTESQPFHC